ncbi:hypothetical protein NDU88_001186 [Pleurodeles waltl]|uniref:Uncharacterized protein n=1 Tax=Pleurodeles waltl TaxID=8319 RepID=A0AAV7TIG7_PLEWA|nr:hypothetical protein NDU88_001186 [Pleurodeles waltl]
MGRGSAAHFPHLQRTGWGFLRSLSLLRLRGLGPSLFRKCPRQCGSGPRGLYGGLSWIRHTVQCPAPGGWGGTVHERGHGKTHSYDY